MNVKIKETGKFETLEIRDRNTNISYVQDLIGNTGFVGFEWSDEDDAYLVDQDTYDWWSNYISDAEQTENDVEALAEKLGIDQEVIWERINQDVGNDYDDHRSSAIRAMEEIQEEYA